MRQIVRLRDATTLDIIDHHGLSYPESLVLHYFSGFCAV